MFVAQFLIVSGLVVFILSVVYMVGALNVIQAWKAHRAADKKTKA